MQVSHICPIQNVEEILVGGGKRRLVWDVKNTKQIIQTINSISIMPFSWCVVAVTLPIKVSVNIKCQASIYTLSLCRRHSWRVRLAKQETLTPPGHLVSPLVCRGP